MLSSISKIRMEENKDFFVNITICVFFPLIIYCHTMRIPISSATRTHKLIKHISLKQVGRWSPSKTPLRMSNKQCNYKLLTAYLFPASFYYLIYMHQLILEYYTFIAAQLMFSTVYIMKIVMVSLLFLVWHKNIRIEHSGFQREIRILIFLWITVLPSHTCTQKFRIVARKRNGIRCIWLNYLNCALFITTHYYNLVNHISW